jgi:hypothetical protein
VINAHYTETKENVCDFVTIFRAHGVVLSTAAVQTLLFCIPNKNGHTFSFLRKFVMAYLLEIQNVSFGTHDATCQECFK